VFRFNHKIVFYQEDKISVSQARKITIAVSCFQPFSGDLLLENELVPAILCFEPRGYYTGRRVQRNDITLFTS